MPSIRDMVTTESDGDVKALPPALVRGRPCRHLVSQRVPKPALDSTCAYPMFEHDTSDRRDHSAADRFTDHRDIDRLYPVPVDLPLVVFPAVVREVLLVVSPIDSTSAR
jgi:hypothetical protein